MSPFGPPCFLSWYVAKVDVKTQNVVEKNNEHDRGHFSIICLQFLGLRKRFDKFWNLNYAAQIYQTWKDHKKLTKRARALIFFSSESWDSVLFKSITWGTDGGLGGTLFYSQVTINSRKIIFVVAF